MPICKPHCSGKGDSLALIYCDSYKVADASSFETLAVELKGSTPTIVVWFIYHQSHLLWLCHLHSTFLNWIFYCFNTILIFTMTILLAHNVMTSNHFWIVLSWCSLFILQLRSYFRLFLVSSFLILLLLNFLSRISSLYFLMFLFL